INQPNEADNQTQSSDTVPDSPVENFEEDDDFGEFEDEFEDTDTIKVFDPLSGYNRLVTRFNDKFYDWLIKPSSTGYNFIVPKKGRIAVRRFFNNVFFPVRFANNFLQLKYHEAAIETARFIINSTVGILGFFDPAEDWLNLKPHPEDFGQTLGFYGVGSGFHIVIPILGPSNLRDVLGVMPDVFVTPIAYFSEPEIAFSVEAYRQLNDTSLTLGEYESIRKDALDLYTFMRDAYEQKRNKEIEE
ncbi:MAG: VacJ family lipoprotein, partial [Nitrospiria bacterium]